MSNHYLRGTDQYQVPRARRETGLVLRAWRAGWTASIRASVSAGVEASLNLVLDFNPLSDCLAPVHLIHI